MMSRFATVGNFLRAMGAIYTVAFVSFGVQASGLVGSRGISPATAFLEAAREQLGARAYWEFPNLLWLHPADWTIAALWILGALCGLIALAGWKQRAALAGCWMLWLSVCYIGQDFFSYQWDMLLLEAGFLAMFAGRSVVRVWLFRLLIFRLMFSSGAVKLASGDLAWRGLTAMGFHYETQPLPTPLAWYMHQLPAAFHRASTVMVFVIELAVPFLFFAPRRLRVIGAWMTIGLQVLILLTGNYAFFNWLTIALCGWLFVEPEAYPRSEPRTDTGIPASVQVLRHWCDAVLAIVVGPLALMALAEVCTIPIPAPGLRWMELVGPLRIVNSYGLFAVMTTTRPEIIVEGSNDGENWQAYEFRDKPGDVRRAPPIVAPHQPRLDWQMWFAALGTVQQNRWFLAFVEKLLRGEPAVLGLMAYNPFPQAPPGFIRARVFQYHFTHFGEKPWWRREEQGVYLPPVSLRH